MISTPTTCDEFTYPSDRIGQPRGVLRGKPLIDMVVPIQDEIGIMIVKDLPKILTIEFGPTSRAKQRDVPVGEGTKVGVGRQICREPLPLRRGRTTAPGISTIGI